MTHLLELAKGLIDQKKYEEDQELSFQMKSSSMDQLGVLESLDPENFGFVV